jgi:hypothetical protein
MARDDSKWYAWNMDEGIVKEADTKRACAAWVANTFSDTFKTTRRLEDGSHVYIYTSAGGKSWYVSKAINLGRHMLPEWKAKQRAARRVT